MTLVWPICARRCGPIGVSGRNQNLPFDVMKRVALAFGDQLEKHTFAPTKV